MVPKTKAKKRMEDIYPAAYQVARNVESMMVQNKEDRDTIAKLLNVTRQTLWRRLTKEPYSFTMLELEILSKHWGVSVDRLIGETMKEERREAEILDRLEELLENYATKAEAIS
jgi:iron-sulfur cluster repair protein YtfE (RIC family)